MSIEETFLSDEVRCGFVVPTAIKQAWAAELEVLMEIDRVCRLHDITYYADWGTLLGAVRHGGFVPWDDDLDIVMKRADYQKFMEIARFDMEEGFDVQTFRNQPDFWLFMGKVVNKNHFCFEKGHLRRFHNFPYIACVDIFVLDYVYKDPLKEEERKTICKYMLGIADGIVEGQIKGEDREWHLRRLEQMTGQHYDRITDPVAMGRYLYGEVEKRFAEVPEQKADDLVQMFPWGLKQEPHYYSKEYYRESVYLPFEYTTIPVPLLYDKMLRERYGDYLKLVKDAGAHDYPFFEGQKKNLQKVLDFPLPSFQFDRSKMERTEEELEYKQKSYKELGEECLQELLILKKQIIYEFQDRNPEAVAEAISVSQQLAIDFGTMLEQVGYEKSEIVKCLEQYCEELYQLYQMYVTVDSEIQDEATLEQDSDTDSIHANFNKLSDIVRRMEQEWSQNVRSKKRILFLISHSTEWENIRLLWKEKLESPDCVPYLVILPYYDKDYDGSPMKWHMDEMAELVKFVDVDEGRILDMKQLTAEYLELLHPEQIYIQNPYDEWNTNISIPPLFYAANILKYTDELIYVSPYGAGELYGKDSREYRNMQYYVTMPGVMYADRILLDSENKKICYVEKLTEFAGEETKEAWEKKIQVWNTEMNSRTQCEHETNGSTGKKRLLYGISLGTYMENPEAAKQKIKDNLHVFEEYKDSIEVTVYLFPEKVSESWMSVKNEIRDLFRNMQRESGRMSSDWMLVEEHMRQYDQYNAYYGDPMPVVMKFYEQKKPVMIQNMQIV
ncbi:MAG: LicD family protein [Lachnospiraceae bacterium]|nr:LicD family protein [Lachnospiraceae bacterium]